MFRRVCDGRRGKDHADGRPKARLAGEADAAAVLVHDVVNDGQAQPVAGGLRGEEGIKDARHVLLRDAGACVGEGQAQAAVLSGRRDGDMSRLFHRFEAVEQEIQAHLL